MSSTNINIDPSCLICCISQDWLEDPVLTPCSHLVSRQELKRWMESHLTCPKCRADISQFNVDAQNKLYDIIALVDQAKSSNVTLPKSDEKSGEWKAELICLHNHNHYQQTKIGKLVVKHTTNNMNPFRTLLIAVVDHSGSMNGNPIVQAQESLKSIVNLTFSNKNLVSTMVAYSDSAIWRNINSTISSQEHFQWIDNLSKYMGGTSFSHAFKEIEKVYAFHESDDTITSVEIIFLTDGEDYSYQSTEARKQLSNRFKSDMNKICKKPWTVHAVGFGVKHDAEFLDHLRKSGTKEGAYRYAEPDENIDSLLAKIQSVVRVIVEKSTIPISLEQSQTPLLQGSGTVYYMDITEYDDWSAPYCFTLKVGEQLIKLEAKSKELDEPEEKIEWEQWFGLQIDKIAAELQPLNELAANSKTELANRIHFELLLLRARSILSRLNAASADGKRLTSLIEMIRSSQKGDAIDTGQLNDMAFEGKFKTVYESKPVNSFSLSGAKFMPTTHITQSRWVNSFKDQWTTFNMSKYGGFVSANSENELLKVLATGPNEAIVNYLESHRNEIKNFRNAQNCTLLSIASSFNRGRVVEWLLQNAADDCDMKAVDNFGNNAMDLSIINGTWFTFERLYEKGLRPTKDICFLLRSCLTKGHDQATKIGNAKPFEFNKYFRTASLLFKYRLVMDIQQDMISSVPYLFSNVAKWLTERSKSGMSLSKAIQMGMDDMIDTILQRDEDEKINHYSLQECFGVFARPTPVTVQIIEKLIIKNKIDIIETVAIQVNVMENNNILKDKFEEEDSWPLYAAAEKGRLDMVQMILKHNASNINRTNRRHVTALWIATCNGHIDVVMELLSAGADPNICNENGSSALIPCCRKGYAMLAQLLLDHGLSLDHYVKERDHPILQCCRDGQAEVLETIFAHLKQKEQGEAEIQKWLNIANPIDGYTPLLAASELGYAQCVRVCIQNGANIEHRTDEDNQIIAGATALHVAALNLRINVIQILRECNCDMLSQTTVLRQNVMHLAVLKKSAELVYYLRSTLSAEELQKLNVKDIDGRLPAFYAHCKGNELLRDEFFIDRLSNALDQVASSDEKVSTACVEVIERFGRTAGCFDYNQIIGKLVGQKEIPLLSKALLSWNSVLVFALNKLGADWYQEDSFGLTPRFWALMMNQTSTKLIHCDFNADSIKNKESFTQQLVNQVQTDLKSSVQVKLLLNISRGPSTNTNMDSGDKAYIEISELQQMQNGFGLEIPSQAVLDLRFAQTKEISLMNWIEKLKHIFAPGKQIFETLIWDAKIHVIAHLAKVAKENLIQSSDSKTEETKQSGSSMGSLTISKTMPPMNIFALYLYTAHPEIFLKVNETLAKWQSTQSNIWKPFVSSLYQSILSLPEYEGECYRALDIQFDEKVLAIGSNIEWQGFTMTSLQWNNCADLIPQKRGIIFIIKSKHARIISAYSARPADFQCVFPPHSKFTVVNHYVANVIALQQMNIRGKTYKMFDYEKVKRNKACIIVELQEN